MRGFVTRFFQGRSAFSRFAFALCALVSGHERAHASSEGVLETSPPFAWCIVPYDEPERTPTERMAMLKRLGIREYVWDWRERHIATLAQEIRAAHEGGIKLRGVWLWIDARVDSPDALGPANEAVIRAVEQAGLKLEYWVGYDANVFAEGAETEKVQRGAAYTRMLRDRAAQTGSTIGLYNHGGWSGEPRNQIQIIQAAGGTGVGIVYNFHHGHEHLAGFADLAREMAPYLLAVNLNGMRPRGPKILPVGEGTHESSMVQALRVAGFRGPWGILGHVEGVDVEPILRENLAGFHRLGLE